MSQQPINRSEDLQALLGDGYELDIVSGHLVIYNVPYLNAEKQVKRGTLVSVLDLAGDVTQKPKSHVAMFAGEHPCDKNGNELKQIKHNSEQKTLGGGLVVNHAFSCKPREGYRDYYHKMTTYVAHISGPARSVDPNATAQTRAVVESSDSESVFKYIDSASSRAGINVVNDNLKDLRIGIVGLGGTGSYILDLVAKTPVREIHLFDNDEFLQHNAFRSPGAPSIKQLRTRPKKVKYHATRYRPMRRGIVCHDVALDASNVHMLDGMDFVFICVDRGEVKLPIVEKLEELEIPFVDVGMGIDLVGDQLLGQIRVTTSTPEMRGHVRDKKRFSLSSGGADGVYSQNIQIAELNALNAAFAVIKWKKLYGFYLDQDKEHSATYTIDGNWIANQDFA